MPASVPILALAFLVALTCALPAWCEDGAESRITLRAADLVALAERFARYSDELPPVTQLGVAKILAYEEHPHFVYIRGRGPAGDRRIVFCKPTTFVIYDIPASPLPWRLVSSNPAKIDGDRFFVSEGDTVVTGEALLSKARIKLARTDGEHVVEMASEDPAVIPRFVHSLHVADAHVVAPSSTFAEADGKATLKLAVGKRTFTITLPAEVEKSGSIAVAEAGELVLKERLLPAGILPHGTEGVRMLERWDSAYRRDGTPGWDVGRTATELRRAFESGDIRPGRALVLGCGAGTNAIYLASKGFDVTGVDLAPTALALAEKRARTAGVRVRWLLSDVVTVPDVEPFDFIFDRGCYHHVHIYDAAGYVATLNRLSRAGSRSLILAGNANEPRHYGPPRVEETDIVNDFAESWDFIWLKEIRFDSSDSERTDGPWAWSALLRRKTQAQEATQR